MGNSLALKHLWLFLGHDLHPLQQGTYSPGIYPSGRMPPKVCDLQLVVYLPQHSRPLFACASYNPGAQCKLSSRLDARRPGLVPLPAYDKDPSHDPTFDGLVLRPPQA